MLRDVSFMPSIVEVGVGDTVTWTHQDGNVPHSVTSTSGPSSFDSHPACTPPGTPLTCMTEGDRDFAVTFEQGGTWEYHCKVHASMTGVVVVEAEPAATTTSSPSTTTTTAAASATTEATERPPPETTEPQAAAPVEPGEPPPGGGEPAPGDGEDAAPADDASDTGSAVLLALALVLVVAVGSGLLWRFRPRRLASDVPVEAIVVEDDA